MSFVDSVLGRSAGWVTPCFLKWMVFSGVEYSLLGLKIHCVREFLP